VHVCLRVVVAGFQAAAVFDDGAERDSCPASVADCAFAPRRVD
jgi:hypothetical protein